MRQIYFVIGVFFVAVGVVGAFLPVLPTTPFLVLALACFSRSSPRLENWLLNHEQFGPPLRAWREHGAIPRKAKFMALVGICIGFTIFMATASPGPILALAVGALMLFGLVFVFTRPSV